MKKLEEIVGQKADVYDLPDGWRMLEDSEMKGYSKGPIAYENRFGKWGTKAEGQEFLRSYKYIVPIDSKDYPQRSEGDKRSDPMPTGTWCIILPDQLDAFLEHNPEECKHHNFAALKHGQEKAIYVHKTSDNCLCILKVTCKGEVNYLLRSDAKAYEIPGINPSAQIHLRCNDVAAIEYELNAILDPEKPKALKRIPDKCYLVLDKNNVDYFLKHYEIPGSYLSRDITRLVESNLEIAVRDSGAAGDKNFYRDKWGFTEVWMTDPECKADVTFGVVETPKESPVVNKIDIPKGHYIVVTKENFDAANKVFNLEIGSPKGVLGSAWFKSMNEQGSVALVHNGWMPMNPYDGQPLSGDEWYEKRGTTRYYWHESENKGPAPAPKISLAEVAISKHPYTHANATVTFGSSDPVPVKDVKISIDPKDIKGDSVALAAAAEKWHNTIANASWSSFSGPSKEALESFQSKIQKQMNEQLFGAATYAGSYFPADINPVYLPTPKENAMFSREEEKIRQYLASQTKTTKSGPGLVRKTAGLGFSVLNWALISPAKSLVRPGLKLIQYGIFAAATIASGYAGWQLSKSVDLPSIQSPFKWDQTEVKSPSDK